MKSLACSVMALRFAPFMGGRAHARDVQLFVPIADAVAATDLSDRRTGAVKFFFVTQKTPEILKYLGSTSPRREPASRACLINERVTKLSSGPLSTWKNAPKEPAPMLW